MIRSTKYVSSKLAFISVSSTRDPKKVNVSFHAFPVRWSVTPFTSRRGHAAALCRMGCLSYEATTFFRHRRSHFLRIDAGVTRERFHLNQGIPIFFRIGKPKTGLAAAGMGCGAVHFWEEGKHVVIATKAFRVYDAGSPFTALFRMFETFGKQPGHTSATHNNIFRLLQWNYPADQPRRCS